MRMLDNTSRQLWESEQAREKDDGTWRGPSTPLRILLLLEVVSARDWGLGLPLTVQKAVSATPQTTS